MYTQITHSELKSQKSFYKSYIWKHFYIYIDMEVACLPDGEDGIGIDFIEF